MKTIEVQIEEFISQKHKHPLHVQGLVDYTVEEDGISSYYGEQWVTQKVYGINVVDIDICLYDQEGEEVELKSLNYKDAAELRSLIEEQAEQEIEI
jgi:hypothetical protein